MWHAIQVAAIDLVDTRGFTRVTVDDIAGAAGISRRTFFNHFATKAAALFDPHPDDAEQLAALLAEADGTHAAWMALRTVCVQFVAGHENVLAVRRRLIEDSPELDQYHRTAHRHVEIALEVWARHQPGLDPHGALLMAQSAGAVITSAFAAWAPDDQPQHLFDLVALGFDRLQAGFGAPG
ncbi:MAG: hypothetical protein JWP31_1887 [Aeromicrobium sp.]|nr:hypothetical protein [Aeromicrobium sp.]